MKDLKSKYKNSRIYKTPSESGVFIEDWVKVSPEEWDLLPERQRSILATKVGDKIETILVMKVKGNWNSLNEPVAIDIIE